MDMDLNNISICVCDINLYNKAEFCKQSHSYKNAKSEKVIFKKYFTSDDLSNNINRIYYVHVSENENIIKYNDNNRIIDPDKILKMSENITDSYKRREMLNDYLSDKLTYDQLLNNTIGGIKSINKITVTNKITDLISPLIFALQSYSAIDKNETGWNYLGKDEYPGWLSEEFEIEKSLIQCELNPNKNAFMLIDGVEWDYYATIFDMMLSKYSDEGVDGAYEETTSLVEKERYDEDNKFYALLDKFLILSDREDWLTDLMISFSENKAKINKIFFQFNLNKRIYDITYHVFVKKIRELTAILANTIIKENQVYCYKGNNCDSRDEILSELFAVMLTELDDTRHSKLESKPELYSKLTQQLDGWLKADLGINYFIVYDGLNQIINRLREFCNARSEATSLKYKRN